MKYAILILVCVVMLFPLWLMVTNGFSNAKQFLKFPPRLLPQHWSLENFKRILSIPLLGRWVVNSLVIAASVVVLGVIVNGAAGYAFAFARTKWSGVMFWLMMTPIFVTRMTVLIAQFVVVSAIKLRGWPAVVATSVFWSTGIFLFRNYFREIPMSILESARLDGANEWTVLTKVVLPISRPMVGTAVVFLGMGTLGDYIWQMLNLQRAETQTYIVGLIASATDVYMAKNIGYELAIGTFVFVPYLILFALSSGYFIGGLTSGALKE